MDFRIADDDLRLPPLFTCFPQYLQLSFGITDNLKLKPLPYAALVITFYPTGQFCNETIKLVDIGKLIFFPDDGCGIGLFNKKRYRDDCASRVFLNVSCEILKCDTRFGTGYLKLSLIDNLRCVLAKCRKGVSDKGFCTLS